MNETTLRRRVAVIGDGGAAAHVIARGVPGYDVVRGAPCDLAHAIGDVPAPAGVPILRTAEEPRPGAAVWHPGVDLRRFNPGRARGHAPLPGEIAVLPAGRGEALVAQAFPLARARDARLRLAAPPSPVDDERAVAFARADLIVAVDATTRTVLEAQASGVAVIAAGTTPLVRDGHTGRACAADAEALARAILELAADAPERARLGRAARYSTRGHSCEIALARLGELYDAALAAEAVPAAA